jgi:hypothetical protein
MSLFVTMRASPPPRPHLTFATRVMISWKPTPNPLPRHRMIGLLASLITLSATAPASATTTTYTDADVVTEITNGTTGTSTEDTIEYIIGETEAFDTNMGSVNFDLLGYTQLTIQNGSTVQTGNNAYFNGRRSTLTVTGAGSQLLLKKTSKSTGLSISPGKPNNTLQILDGGYIEAGNIFMTGTYSTAGTIEISGTGSILETHYNTYMVINTMSLTFDIGSGGLWDANGFDANGQITMNLNSGGTLRVATNFSVNNIDTFNFNSGSTLIALAAVSDLGPITAGQTVDISSGSLGTATTLNGGSLNVGDYAMTNLTFTSGTLNAGGTLTNYTSAANQTLNLNSGGAWDVGNNATFGGTVNLTGGTLYTQAFDASELDSFTSGTITATGIVTNLPTLSTGRNVNISSGGSFGDATVLNGGAITVGDFALTNLTFTSGTLNASGTLTNLPELSSGRSVDISSGGSFGDATTLNGGSVTVDDFALTNLTFTSGTLNASGALTNLPELVSGYNVDISSGGTLGEATTLNGGTLTTGDFAMTNLTFTSGILNASGTLTSYSSAADQTLNLNSGGEWDAGDNPTFGGTVNLTGGALDVQTFDASQLASFTSGTLTTTGALTNLNALSSANQTIIVDGGTWAPSGDISTGNLTIQNDGGVTVGDYSASNLTFTAGSLNASGILTNLPELVSGHSVNISAGGSFGDATTLNGGTLTTGTFALTNLTFSSGTLNASGTLTNLPELVSGHSVDISSGGSFGDATVLNGGALTVGDFALTNLTYTSGSLAASGALTNLPALISGHSVDITSGGSFGDATTLNGGTLTTGNFGMTNLTFTSGTLAASGALSNLPTLSSGHSVDITSGGSFGDATTLDGGTLITGDFALANLTFTSGTLNASGTLTNYASAANQTLNLNTGGTWDAGDAPAFGGTVNLTGGSLNVDDFDASQLDSFTSGALNVAGTLTNYSSAADETLNIIAGGTWDVGNNPYFYGAVNLAGGTIEAEGLNASRLTSFTSGTLNLSGYLYNYTSEANQTLNINAGAEWDANSDPTISGTVNLNGGRITADGIDASQIASFTSGTLYSSYRISNLSEIVSGQIIDIVDGSFYTATTLNGGTVIVRDFDLTNLTFTSGTLEASGILENLPELVSGHHVNISSGGSFADATTLNGGTLTTGDFGMTNLTFSSGTLAASGILTNLPELTSGRSVDISSSGSLGDATTLNGGTLTTGTFALTNLTFTSGTLAAGGILTNLPELVSGHHVDISSGGSLGEVTNLNGGTLTTGDFAMTNLTFTSGTLNAAGTLTNYSSAANQTLNLNAGGAWDAGDNPTFNGTVNLTGGSLDVQVLNASQLGSFTSGTLTATGALTNLNTLSSADQTVIIDGGSWSPTGSIDAGNLTLQNSGVLTVGDYNVANLTFTSGTLNAEGTLTGYTNAADQTLNLNAGGAWDAGNNPAFSGTVNLTGGSLSVQTFDANELASFTSGTLESTGTLTGLTSLGSGATARVTGSSAVALQLNQTLTLDGGTLEIANGASATPLGSGAIAFDATNGGEIALDGGTLNIASMSSTLTLNASASVTGNGSIFGNVNLGFGGTIDGDATGLNVFGHISGSGTLADTTLYGNLNIGNSPGDIYLENTTLSSATIVTLAIEGPDLGQFDRLFVDANSNISAATLNITFEGYTPASLGLTFSLVSNSSSTTFGTITTPEGWSFNGTTLSNLSAVPEPGTYALLVGLATLGLAATRRRRC